MDFRGKKRSGDRIAAVAASAATECTITIPERDSRSSDRVDVFQFGKVATPGAQEVPCIVRDISENGARIRMESAVNLPLEFTLRIKNRPGVFKARLIWQQHDDVGVEFLEIVR